MKDLTNVNNLITKLLEFNFIIEENEVIIFNHANGSGVQSFDYEKSSEIILDEIEILLTDISHIKIIAKRKEIFQSILDNINTQKVKNINLKKYPYIARAVNLSGEIMNDHVEYDPIENYWLHNCYNYYLTIRKKIIDILKNVLYKNEMDIDIKNENIITEPEISLNQIKQIATNTSEVIAPCKIKTIILKSKPNCVENLCTYLRNTKMLDKDNANLFCKLLLGSNDEKIEWLGQKTDLSKLIQILNKENCLEGKPMWKMLDKIFTFRSQKSDKLQSAFKYTTIQETDIFLKKIMEYFS